MPIPSCFKGQTVQENISLADKSSFKVGGNAKFYSEPKTFKQLRDVLHCATENHIPFVILGGCTNVLISDSGYPGLVIRYAGKHVTHEGTGVTCESGLSLQQLLSYCAKNQLSGLEHLTGIPGSVGGAIRGNAGTATQWIDTAVQSVQALDVNTLEMRTFNNAECRFSYRNSFFKEHPAYIITESHFSLKKSTEPEIRSVMAEFIRNRSAQPVGVNSAGCIFKNPPGTSAGKIIDQLGLKGKSMGGASVSTHHANFIITKGEASASDIVMLISYIKQQVRDKMGIQLQEEIEYIGF